MQFKNKRLFKSLTRAVVVDVIIAGSTSISNTIEVNGTVLAFESAELHPEVNGRLVLPFNVPEGKFIQQGTVIARINDADPGSKP